MSALKDQVGGSHYKNFGIQPVEYCHANGLDFFQGCIVKYATRFREKNGRQDLEKIKHFVDLLIELEYPENEPEPEPEWDPLGRWEPVEKGKSFGNTGRFDVRLMDGREIEGVILRYAHPFGYWLETEAGGKCSTMDVEYWRER